MADGQNGWSKYEYYVVTELKRLSDKMDALGDDVRALQSRADQSVWIERMFWAGITVAVSVVVNAVMKGGF